MTPEGRGRAANAPSRELPLGLLRAVASAPALFGSSLLALGLVGLGAWARVVALIWTAGAVALATPAGERTALRAVCGFHRPNPAQAAVLGPAWTRALRAARAATGDVDLYVQKAGAPNAYAVGGRSVAITSRTVEEVRSGRLGEEQLVAVLAHELGHHATGASRAGLIVAWLAAPWRVTAGALTRLAGLLAGRRPRQEMGAVAVAGMAVARSVPWSRAGG